MNDEEFVRRVLFDFERIADERLEPELTALREAIETKQFEFGANAIVPRLYAKDKELVRSDLLATLRDGLPERDFDRIRELVMGGYSRAAAYEISDLINRRLWHPSEEDERTMKAFWDYYCG